MVAHIRCGPTAAAFAVALIALSAIPAVAVADAPPSLARAARPDPADPQAQVPPLRHRSALTAYRRLDNTALADWRTANDTTARVGGWRAYAREANAPAPAASAAPSMPGHDHPRGGQP